MGCQDQNDNQLLIQRVESEQQLYDWATAAEERLPEEADYTYFARVSLDLRGHRPSLDELAEYEQNPASMESFIDQWVQEKSFATQMAWYWNDAMHTTIWASQIEIWDLEPFEIRRSLGWEPLAFVEKIVFEDRPFRELVTVDKLPTDPVLAEIYGMNGSANWTWSDPPDDRVMAGVLSSRFLWTRYRVDILNYNRRRANHFSRIFLCHDYLERDIVFSSSALLRPSKNLSL